MKKLFSLFCCLLLTASMVTQAQETPSVAFFDYGDDKLNCWNDYVSFSTFIKTEDKFLQLEFTQRDKTSNNYVMFSFWVDASHYRTIDGIKFPVNGTYYKRNFIADGLYGSSCDDAYMYVTVESDDYLNAAFMGKGQEFCSSDCGYTLCNTGATQYETYWASYNNGSVTGYNYTIETVIISDGVGKYPCIKAYDSSSNLLIKIDLKMEGGTITAVSNNNSYGTITGTAGASTFVNGTEYPSGTSISLTAVPEANYSLLEWRDGDGNQVSTNTSINFNVNGNASYTAVFAPTHTITVTSEDASKGTTTGGGTYAEGASVTISASGLNGYVFSQWSDGNTNNPRTITVGNADASYTAQFILQTMSVASCSDASISFHCDYSDITTHGKRNYFYGSTYGQYCNEMQIAATNSDNKGFKLFFTRPNDMLTRRYNGGECNNIDCAYPDTYGLWLAAYATYGSGWNAKKAWACPGENAVVCYNTSGNNTPSDYSYIKNGTNSTIKLRRGSITVSENNVGGIFIETSGVSNWNNEYQSIYFTFGNRNEYTVNLGTGTMSVTPSSLTMSASNGNNSASIKLNSNTTGNKTLSNFDVSNSCFVYNGTPLSNISNITGTLSSSIVGGVITYTLTLKIRDCQQNLYNVTMSATAPSFALGWGANGGVLTGGTAAGSVQFGATITAPTGSLAGSALTGWSPDFTGTMPANDVTYTAQWTQKTYTLSATTNPAGLGSVTFSKSAPYHYLDEVTLTAPAATGYTFSGWGGTNSSMMSGNVFTFSADDANNIPYAVTANYTANPYTITLNNQSATTGGTSSQTVDYRTALPDITVPTKTGNAFGGYFTETNGGGTMLIGTDGKWVKNVSGYTDASGNLIHAGNFDLYAKWTELVTFTIADYSNGTVTVTPNDGSGSFTSGSRNLAVGTMVSFSAVANPNYHINNVNLNIKESDNSFSASSAYTLQAGDGTVTLTANFLPDTYAITYNKGANGTGADIDAGEKTYNVDFTLSNSTFTRTGYTQTGWSTEDGGSKAYDLGDTYTGNTALTLYPYWEKNTYTITWMDDDNETELASQTYKYEETPVYPNATPTKAADSEYTYTFNAWTPAIATVTTAATYTATYSTTKVQYTLTWDVNGGNALTGTYTNGTIDWGTAITKPADPTKAGYTFNGWDADNDGTADVVATTMPTSDVTYKALWILSSMDALTLLDKESATYYDNFQDYDGVDVETVTYTRNFTAGNWSTLCLPFDVTEGNLILNGLSGQVFAFQHATGNANVGSQVLLYFIQVSSLEAGVPYLVRTRNNKSNFTFESVTINTEADTEADITALGKTHMTEGTIALVGTLRKGTLPKGDKHYMGLMGNKIYYPGENTTVPAYRAYFYDSNPSGVQQRVRIVVDGEDMGELLIDNGELLDAGGDDRAPRKYIRHGNLYIEREGVIYDAQGKRM